MLTLRYLRTGRKKQPSFRIVVVESARSPKSGDFVEQVGFYNPLTKEKKVNKERVEHWLSKGVQPSASVYNLLVREGIVKGEKISVHKKSKKKQEEKTQENSATEQKPIEEATDGSSPGDLLDESSEKQREPSGEPEEKQEEKQAEEKPEKPLEEKEEKK
jgi:small subunit ribosomal protein S16